MCVCVYLHIIYIHIYIIELLHYIVISLEAKFRKALRVMFKVFKGTFNSYNDISIIGRHL